MCKRNKSAKKTLPKTSTSWFSAYAFINDELQTDFLSKIDASNTSLSLIFCVTISLHKSNWNVFDEWLWFRYENIRNYFPHFTKILILLMKNLITTTLAQKVGRKFMLFLWWQLNEITYLSKNGSFSFVNIFYLYSARPQHLSKWKAHKLIWSVTANKRQNYLFHQIE